MKTNFISFFIFIAIEVRKQQSITDSKNASFYLSVRAIKRVGPVKKLNWQLSFVAC